MSFNFLSMADFAVVVAAAANLPFRSFDSHLDGV